MREVADRRDQGSTGETPAVRFAGAEAGRLKPPDGIPSFRAARGSFPQGAKRLLV